MPISTRTRLTLYFTVLFGVIVIAVTIGTFVLVRNDVYSKLDSGLRVAVHATAMSAEHELNEHATEPGGDADLQAVLDERQDDASIASTQILVRQGSRVVAFKGPADQRPDLRSISPGLLKMGATVDGLRIETLELQLPKFGTRYQIYSSAALAPALHHLRRVEQTLLLLIPLGLATAALIGYLLARKSLAPLTELTSTIAAVSSSDLSARVRLQNPEDDIGRLGWQFNQLLDRLERAFTVQRQFMADASHELRTPVTVALTAAQVTARDPARTVADCTDALDIVEEQMLRLKRIVQDMLFLSQADASPVKAIVTEMYLDDAVAEASRTAQTLARGKKQTLRVQTLPEARCRGDQELLRQTVLILLENAVKFTPEKGQVELAVERRGGAWVCSVIDDGAGIPSTAQPRIFERFFRAEHARDDKVPGCGLGLAIAKSIIERHNGTVRLVASRPGFTHFEISIPALGDDGSEKETGHANSLAVKI
ncbi:MAG: ATP-binding protein [Acidobacteriota bacterium]|nr:ATP-binding protein [Acidobacteriota bacterium]